MIKEVTHAHLRPIWYLSEPSNVPYSPNQSLGWDFFAVSYSKPTLTSITKFIRQTEEGLVPNLVQNRRSHYFVSSFQKGLILIFFEEVCLMIMSETEDIIYFASKGIDF